MVRSGISHSPHIEFSRTPGDALAGTSRNPQNGDRSVSIDIQSEPKTVSRVQAVSVVRSEKSPAQSKNPWMTRGIIAAVALLFIGLVAAATLKNSNLADQANILTHQVVRSDLTVTVTEDGTLESASNKEIKCKVKGGSTILWIIEDGSAVTEGDELVRLDSSSIEDTISQQQITYENALATKIKAESDLAVAEINVKEYLEGTFRKEMQTAESNVAIAEENLRVAQNVLSHAKKMFRKGYVSELELDSNKYSLQYAQLQLDLMKTQVDVLERFTKPKMMQDLESQLKAAKAKLASDEAAFKLEEGRLERARKQLDNCIIKAESSGKVIYPPSPEWRETPAIEEGAAVREQQTLLVMPDLNNMQVRVGIHESKVDLIKKGMPATIEIQGEYYEGSVVSIATQASPSGWWDGHIRRFDVFVKLDEQRGANTGMSAAVEIVVAEHKDVLTVPVAAVVEHEQKFYCWVRKNGKLHKRTLKLGDSNDQFIIVQQGISERDLVVLNPWDVVDEARENALKPRETKTTSKDQDEPAESQDSDAKDRGTDETGQDRTTSKTSRPAKKA